MLYKEIDSWRLGSVILCLRRCMRVMDSHALRTSPHWHQDNGTDNGTSCNSYGLPQKRINDYNVTVGWKPILYSLFGQIHQSFRNKSGKTQPIQTKFGIHGHVKGDNVQGILGAIGPFWPKWGLGRVQRSANFVCDNPENLLATLATKSNSVSRQWIWKDIFENFHFRNHMPPKSAIENRSNRHLTQSRLQIRGCTPEIYCLLRVGVQAPESFRGRSIFLYDVRLRSYRISDLPHFRILAYFPHTNPL